MFDDDTPVSLDDYVTMISNLDYSFRKLHDYIIMTNEKTGETIHVPIDSLTVKYRDFLEESLVTLSLTEREMERYRFQPKALSLKLYETTEFWSELLHINGYTSVLEFKPSVMEVYDPKALKEILNEIMVLENLD